MVGRHLEVTSPKMDSGLEARLDATCRYNLIFLRDFWTFRSDYYASK